MPVEDCYWKKPGSVKLYGKLYIPDVPMNALLVMVHGIGEHCECYEAWAEKFISQSIGLLAFDLRGHGHSSGKRGHATMNQLKSDLKAVIKTAHKKYPDVPIILFGHSMGGQIVLNYATGKGVKVQGIIASSPWLKLVNPPSPILVKLAKIVSYLVPRLTISTGIKADQLSHNGTTVKSSKTDPWIHKKISVKLFCDLWENGEIIMRKKHRLNVPLLLMHGTADQLTSYHASKSFAQNAGEYTTYKQWRGMSHNLLDDDGNEVVFQYVMKWISKQIIKDGVVQNNRKMYCVA